MEDYKDALMFLLSFWYIWIAAIIFFSFFQIKVVVL
jgi:hypothetical protein